MLEVSLGAAEKNVIVHEIGAACLFFVLKLSFSTKIISVIGENTKNTRKNRKHA